MSAFSASEEKLHSNVTDDWKPQGGNRNKEGPHWNRNSAAEEDAWVGLKPGTGFNLRVPVKRVS